MSTQPSPVSPKLCLLCAALGAVLYLASGCDRSPTVGDGARPDAAGDQQPEATAASEQAADHKGSMSRSEAKPQSPAAAAKPGQAADELAAAPPPGKTQATALQRQPLFANWPEPKLVLFLTGQQHGYIEPCGCTGLANQKGGLSRRFTFRKSLLDRGWTVLPLDAGNQVARFGRQAEIKFQVTTEAFKKMGYRAIGLGPDDLRLSAGELVAVTSADKDQAGLFVCANAAVIDRALTPQFLVLSAGGKRIGVTAVLGTDRLSKIVSDEVLKSPPEQSLRQVWAELEKQACDVNVLLAQASLDETRKLAQSVPHFDVIVSADEVGEPAYQAEPIANTKSLLIQVGMKAMYVGVVGLFDGAGPRLRYQRVPLDDRFADAPEMLELLAAYQEQLKAAGLDGLGVKPIPHPSGRQYVGSKACKECHEDAYEVWEQSSHAKALATLMRPGERSEIPRHFDPECLSCHVVGWSPQKFFPYASGYLGADATPRLHNVGCENCHGPGSDHVAAENGKLENFTGALRDKLREEAKLPLAEAEKKCLECHDIDNSINFHLPGAFDKYWQKIEH